MVKLYVFKQKLESKTILLEAFYALTKQYLAFRRVQCKDDELEISFLF